MAVEGRDSFRVSVASLLPSWLENAEQAVAEKTIRVADCAAPPADRHRFSPIKQQVVKLFTRIVEPVGSNRKGPVIDLTGDEPEAWISRELTTPTIPVQKLEEDVNPVLPEGKASLAAIAAEEEVLDAPATPSNGASHPGSPEREPSPTTVAAADVKMPDSPASISDDASHPGSPGGEVSPWPATVADVEMLQSLQASDGNGTMRPSMDPSQTGPVRSDVRDVFDVDAEIAASAGLLARAHLEPAAADDISNSSDGRRSPSSNDKGGTQQASDEIGKAYLADPLLDLDSYDLLTIDPEDEEIEEVFDIRSPVRRRVGRRAKAQRPGGRSAFFYETDDQGQVVSFPRLRRLTRREAGSQGASLGKRKTRADDGEHCASNVRRVADANHPMLSGPESSCRSTAPAHKRLRTDSTASRDMYELEFVYMTSHPNSKPKLMRRMRRLPPAKKSRAADASVERADHQASQPEVWDDAPLVFRLPRAYASEPVPVATAFLPCVELRLPAWLFNSRCVMNTLHSAGPSAHLSSSPAARKSKRGVCSRANLKCPHLQSVRLERLRCVAI